MTVVTIAVAATATSALTAGTKVAVKAGTVPVATISISYVMKQSQ